jgi:hypothetical protein
MSDNSERLVALTKKLEECHAEAVSLEGLMTGPASGMRSLWSRKITQPLRDNLNFLKSIEDRKKELGLK